MLRSIVPQIIKSASVAPCQCQSEANKAEYARTAQIIGTITKKLELNEAIIGVSGMGHVSPTRHISSQSLRQNN